MKNDVFNLDRFGKYLVADLHNAYSNFGLSLLLMSLLGVFAYFINRVFGLIFRLDNDGLGIFFRLAIMGTCLVVSLMVAGKKCYGQVTDRKGGTNFVMLPVSALEKTLSMLFVCCIAVPVALLVISLSADAVICALDGSCGHTMIYTLVNTWKELCQWNAENPYPELFGTTFSLSEAFEASEGLPSLLNPLLYVDDTLAIVLCFLLGALYFKSGKISKTIGCLILFSIAVSMVVSPFAINHFTDLSDEATMSFVKGVFSHAALIDTINDTVINLLLCTAIYFRIKTIKL